MNISAWAIRNPVPVIMLFLVLTALGIVHYLGLPVTYFPTISVPAVRVTITESAGAPTDIESQITKPVEDAVASLSRIRHITSTVSQGRSVTEIEFELGVPVEGAMADVRNNVTKIRSRLPAAIDEPVFEKVETANQPVVTYSVKNTSLSPQALSYFVNDVVLRKIQGLGGVGRVELVGAVDREIQVRLDQSRVENLGLTITGINDQIIAAQLDRSAGQGAMDGADTTVAVKSSAGSLDGLGGQRIAVGQGKTVALSDLGSVVDGIKKLESFAQLNGIPAIGFTVYKAIGGGDVDVASKVEQALAQIGSSNPGTEFQIVDDSVTQTISNFDAAQSTLIEGAILAIIVVFVFLRDWRATLIAAVSLPLSIVPTFFVIDLAGFSLNMLSLLGITLVTGILVDDSIVEIENIDRHRNLGKSALQASLDASGEIGLAVMAISAAIIAVFAPVGLMAGEIGQYFRQFGLTVAVAVFFSLLVARLVTPLLAAHLLAGGKVSSPGSAAPPAHASSSSGVYRTLVRRAIRWRWLTLLAALGLFAGSIVLATRLPTEFLPMEDFGRISFSFELPPGASLEDNQAVSQEISTRLGAIADVKTVFVQAGGGASGSSDVRKSNVTVSVGDPGHRSRALDDIRSDIRDTLAGVPDIRFQLTNDRGSRPVSYAVLSSNGEAGASAASHILKDMRSDPLFVNPASSESALQPELRLAVQPDRAADLGISANDVATAVKIAMSGDGDARLPNFNDKGRLIPIRTLFDTRLFDARDKLEGLRFKTASGGFVPLSAVARIEEHETVSMIQRFERQRQIGVSADLVQGVAQGDGIAAFLALPSVKGRPAGVEIKATGDADTKNNVFTSFAFAMASGLALVVIVLILLFKSVLTPFSIFTPLPLAVTGVVASLMITGDAISLPVVIGILMLMGIVVKNSIMLVDFAVELERSGLSRIDATIEACAERARPIVMTTLAMVAGMLPSAIGHHVGGAFRAPMAAAVIGGLLVSTILSLLVVPAVHVIVENLGDRLRAWFSSMRAREKALA